MIPAKIQLSSNQCGLLSKIGMNKTTDIREAIHYSRGENEIKKLKKKRQ